MIQLKAAPPPVELTAELVQTLTDEYKATDTAVWKKPFIEKALLAMSSGKCAYCECRVTEESKYMEVEHFFPKDIFPEKVVLWDNLLPSCKRCNGHKSAHNPEIEPIIHPVSDNPKEHLDFRAYRFYGKTAIGKLSIEVLVLNDRDRIQQPRFLVGSKTKEKLDDLEIKTSDFLENRTPIRQRRILASFKNLLREGLPSQEFSATVATEILREDSFHFVKKELAALGLWDDELAELEIELARIAFL